VGRFISDFVGLVQPITLMLKKDKEFKLTPKGRQSFERIKKSISTAPILVNPNLSKDFIMYVYGEDHSIVAFLTHKKWHK